MDSVECKGKIHQILFDITVSVDDWTCHTEYGKLIPVKTGPNMII